MGRGGGQTKKVMKIAGESGGNQTYANSGRGRAKKGGGGERTYVNQRREIG